MFVPRYSMTGYAIAIFFIVLILVSMFLAVVVYPQDVAASFSGLIQSGLSIPEAFVYGVVGFIQGFVQMIINYITGVLAPVTNGVQSAGSYVWNGLQGIGSALGL